LRQAYVQLKEKAKARAEKFRRDIALLHHRVQNTEEHFTTRLQASERRRERDQEKAVEVQNALKTKLAEAIEAMKTQAHQGVDLSEKLSDSLAQSEKRNQQITAELSKMSVAKAALEVELKSMTDQMKREMQILQAQSSLRLMNAETKYQENLVALRGTFLKEKNERFISILAEFDDLHEFDAEDITEDQFMAAMSKIADEYHDMSCHRGSVRSPPFREPNL
jgi:hypothetical protein